MTVCSCVMIRLTDRSIDNDDDVETNDNET